MTREDITFIRFETDNQTGGHGAIVLKYFKTKIIKLFTENHI